MKGKMRADLYPELYHVENTHWWHQHKRAVVHQFLNQWMSRSATPAGNKSLLDVGSGTGKILEECKQAGWRVTGADGAATAIEWSRKRGLNVKKVNFNTQPLPFKTASFDAVIALDIIEHLRDDQSITSEIARVTKPGGIIIITVPAYQQLFSYWDQMLGHQRRYTTRTLKQLCTTAPISVVHLGYYFSLLLFPAVLIRRLKTSSRQPTSDFQTTPLSVISVPLITAYLRIERFLLKYCQIPFGLSVLAVLQKR